MELKLIEKRIEVPGVESFIFKPEEPIVWKAGQYLHYVLHHRPTDERGSDRWFTVSSAPFEGKPMITTRMATQRSSSFKQALQALTVGDPIEVSKVEGDFTVEDMSQEYVFIAGGIGVTPYHSILKQLDHEEKRPKITLIYSNRDENVPFKGELELFAKNNPNIKIHYITAPARIDVNVIQKLVPDLQKPFIYISGPKPMVESLSQVVTKMGVPGEHIKLDDFPGYPED